MGFLVGMPSVVGVVAAQSRSSASQVASAAAKRQAMVQSRARNQQNSAPLEGTRITFRCGATMKNRFMLSPMTTLQNHADGQLSDDEFRWLTMRAKGNFGLIATGSAHVHKSGQGFVGQLGIFSDTLLPGHRRLATALRQEGSLAVIQLFHAGIRSRKDLTGEQPLGPSDDRKTGARAMRLDELHQLRDDFVAAAVRAQKAGYDGVEVHGGHHYLLSQFLSSQHNQRTDEYGGPLASRSRILFEILEGIRSQCGKEFLVGLRLSLDNRKMIHECLEVSQKVIDSGLIDFLDVSLYDAFVIPARDNQQRVRLFQMFAGLDRTGGGGPPVHLAVGGSIQTSAQVHKVLGAGIDFVTIGRAAILHHDYPDQVLSNPDFRPLSLPASHEYLAQEGLSDIFINLVAPHSSKFAG